MKNQPLTADNLVSFLEKTGPVTKAQIADAFGITGDIRIALKEILRDLEQSGQLIKVGGQRYALPAGLPDVAPLRITSITLDGDIIAEPTDWDTDRQGPRPKIVVTTDAKEHATLHEEDAILARIKRDSPSADAEGPVSLLSGDPRDKPEGLQYTAEGPRYTATIIRRLDQESSTTIGEVIQTKTGPAIRTLAKRDADVYRLIDNDLGDAKLHDLVEAAITTPRGTDTPVARIKKVIGATGDPRVLSLVAAHEVGLRTEFPPEVIKAAENLSRPTLDHGRSDLRKIPLVTIDGEDARDFDDAVFAEPDDNPENPGGYHLIVAIADVSHYVRAGTPLDDEAYKRGNSTYFPDRVLPMLPEGLSNDLCSLRPKEDRYCLAVHLWVDKNGIMVSHKFVRGLMRSIARLTYTQVQNAYDGNPDATTEPLLRPLIFPLYDAYRLLLKARLARGTLELEMPEKKITVDDTGAMSGVTIRERFASHQLIEEFMILANVAAALALQHKKAPCVYRVHDSPSIEKSENLRTYMATFGIDVPRGEITEPGQLAQILRGAKDKPFATLVSESMLRSQMQAHYSTDNIGHFGLALNHYAHFTSPIRRYADLLVHRSLIRAYGFGDGGLDDETRIKLPAMCEHISITERASMSAERSTVDRFTATFMADKIGQTFQATISSVTRFGLFVRLKDTGADGLIPMRFMDGDFFVHDERLHALVGRRTGMVYRLGAPIMVELIEAAPLAGALMFRAAQDTGADIPGYELNINPDTYQPPFNDRDRAGPGRGGKRDSPGRGGKARGGPPSRGRPDRDSKKGKPRHR